MESVKQSLEDAIDTIDRLENENFFYVREIETLENAEHELRDEIHELNDAVSSLSEENSQLARDARESRVSFTGLQIAISFLVFTYGMMYGSYFRC